MVAAPEHYPDSGRCHVIFITLQWLGHRLLICDPWRGGVVWPGSLQGEGSKFNGQRGCRVRLLLHGWLTNGKVGDIRNSRITGLHQRVNKRCRVRGMRNSCNVNELTSKSFATVFAGRDMGARAIQVRKVYDETMRDHLKRAGNPQHDVASTGPRLRQGLEIVQGCKPELKRIFEHIKFAACLSRFAERQVVAQSGKPWCNLRCIAVVISR